MNIYENIILETEPVVKEIVQATKEQVLKTDQKWTKYDEEYVALFCKYKFVNAIHTYLLPTDKLEAIHVYRGSPITATILIERDGESHKFETDVILAGGYNIQELHNRYIVRNGTGLRKVVGTQPEIKALQTKIKNFTKSQELEKFIRFDEKRIKETEETLPALKAKTQEEIINDSESKRFLYETLADINPGSHNATIILTEEDVKDHNDKIIEQINKVHNQIINSRENQILSWRKRIEMNKIKLNKIK